MGHDNAVDLAGEPWIAGLWDLGVAMECIVLIRMQNGAAMQLAEEQEND